MLLFILSLTTHIGAQTSSPEASTTATPNLTSKEQQLSMEVIELRAQTKQMKEDNQRLLDTVHWSLGGLVTAVALVAGFGWFVNFRMYQRDKDALKKELLTIQKGEINAATQTIRDAALQQYESFKDEVTNSIERKLKAARREILMIRYDQSKSEAAYWEAKGVYTNAIRAYLSMIQVAKERDFDPFISIGLDGVRDSLKAGASPGPDAELVRQITEMLAELPSGFATDAESIRQLLQSLRA